MPKVEYKPILSLDFDGVCHSYTSPWQGPTVIPDPPVPGLYEFLDQAVKQFTVQIYSTRSETAEGRFAMKEWFLDHSPKDFPASLLNLLQFPDSKPKAFVGLDDRILTFQGQWPSIETLRSWKPWNKRPPTMRISGRYMTMTMYFDAESFSDLKMLLHSFSFNVGDTTSMSVAMRRRTEALRRIYDQIRDKDYSDV